MATNGFSRRMRREVAGRDRRSGLLTGGSFLIAMTLWNVLAPRSSVPIAAFLWCVAAFVVVGCVEFEIGPGCALSTVSVQVVMLFLLPPSVVPIAVVLGLLGSSLIARVWDPDRKERAMVLAGSGWQVVGPAAVFALAHVEHAAVADWPVYTLALASQCAFDAANSWVRNCYGLGVAPRDLARSLQFTCLCNVSLAPVGLAAALAVPNSAGALLLLLPPTALLAVLQSDRRRHIDRTIALSAAYADTSDLARRDALTGVSNRLAWEEAQARCRRSDEAVGVVVADVDALKAANDTYGHATGDRLLVAIAELLVSRAKPLDGAPVFRIGGDEFVILLPSAAPDTAYEFASSLREAFEQVPDLDGVVPVRASVGIGHASTGSGLGTAMASADHQLNDDKARRGVGRR